MNYVRQGGSLRMQVAIGCFVGCLGASLGAWADLTTTTPEVSVSSDSATTFAAAPAIGGEASRAVIVWQQLDTALTSGWDILARRYDSAGNALGSVITVAAGSGCERNPKVAVDPSGDFLAVWEAGSSAIKARFFLANGSPLGVEMLVNSTAGDSTHRKLLPAVGVVPVSLIAGTPAKFLIVWQSESQPSGDTSGFAVMGRTLSIDVAGTATFGSEFVINQITAGSQGAPAVSYSPAFRTYAGYTSDRFVVAWQNDGPSSPGVYKRLVKSDGTLDGSEVPVSAADALTAEPAIAADASGNYTIAWREARSDGSFDVKFHRFPKGTETVANPAALRRRTRPTVAALASGDFAISWASEPQDPDGRGVYATYYDVTAAAITGGTEILLNSTVTVGDQESPSGSAVVGDAFLTAWQSALTSPLHTGVRARFVRAARDFFTVTPCRLVDTRVTGGPIAANGIRGFNFISGGCGIPAKARAISINLAVINGGAVGSLVAYPGALDDLTVPPVAPIPETTTVSFPAGISRANNAVLQLAADGSGVLTVKLLSAGSADLTIDVNGYFQ